MFKPLQRPEGDDQPEFSYRASIYCELEWMRLTKKRKPGWTARTFFEIFGVWPQEWMKTLEPQEPRDELRKYINRKHNAFKRKCRKNERVGGDSSVEGRPTKKDKTQHDHAGGDV